MKALANVAMLLTLGGFAPILTEIPPPETEIPPAATDVPSPPEGTPNYRTVDLDEDAAFVGGGSFESNSPGFVAATGAPPDQTRRVDLDLCGALPNFAFDGAMAQLCMDFLSTGGVVAPCVEGERRVDPLLRRVVDVGRASGWSPWGLVEVGGCVGTVDLAGAVAVELARLPLVPSVLRVQPSSGWVLVNVDTIAFSDQGAQTLAATVLGTQVLVRAVPVRFGWDFGDGSAPLVTTDPGAPYPDQTVGHPYRTAGTAQITLTTTWRADFQVVGTATWEPVTGTATTVTSSEPLTVYTARAHLVAEPVSP